MSARDPENTPDRDSIEAEPKPDNTPSDVADRPREIGGRGGLDPTRYGDWEKAGRCIDF
jgi:hypothetical protein